MRASVAVLEAGRIAAGATGYTTAKFTALQRVTLSEVRSRHGDEAAAVYAAANVAAVERVAQLVADDQIDCDFARASACTYAVDRRGVGAIDAECEALLAAGVAARRGDADELPFEVAAAVWLDDQVQLHLAGIASGSLARSSNGGGVFEHSRVLDVTERDGVCTVKVASGELTAGHVVVATHLPFTHRGGYFARFHPYRSYALAARLGRSPITGMYISVDEPTRSIRAAPDGWTVLGGEGHKVGHDDDTRRRYQALEDWARATFDVVEIGWRWSAQDYETVDGLPYVGRLSSFNRQVWTATGFRKWGMSNGTAAAMIIADRIAGRDNPWSKTFDSTRLAVGASIRQLITENLEVGKQLHRRPPRQLAADLS